MKEIIKSYKYRLNPTKAQKVLLDKHFGCSRFVYNYFLNQKIEQYKETKKSDTFNAQSRKLTELKKKEDFLWLNEVNSQSSQNVLKNLDCAFQNFFKMKQGFPKFKSKRKNNSFSVPQAIKLVGDKISVNKFREGIKLLGFGGLVGNIKQCTFSKDCRNNYFVSIVVSTEIELYQPTGKVIGLDLGIKDLVIDSEGTKQPNRRYTKKYENELRTAHKHLSRKKVGGHQYEKQRLKVTKIHGKISNSRKDNLHKLSTYYVKGYDVICIEDLNIKGMVKNRKLSKHIQNCAWGEFVGMLTYKADWNDKVIVKIDRFFPSSKTCHDCGWKKTDLKLHDRYWVCESCGCEHDRDVNASKNILKEGLNLYSAGTVENTDGDDVNLACKLLSVKSEATS